MSRPAPALDARTRLEAPALLERAVGYTRLSLALLPRADPAAATPCAGWDLTRLLRHMDDSLAAFTEAAEAGYVAPRGPAEAQPGALAASLRDRACRLLGAWSARPYRTVVSVAGREVDATLLAAAGALEIAVHGWDVARACGTDRPLPEDLAATLLALAPVVLRPDDRPGRFAAPLVVPASAAASERLLAHLGREVRQPDAPPDGRETGHAADGPPPG